MRDHPRIRGEHVHVGPPSLAGIGSSPHTRGARCRGAGPAPGPGIIPAYAGSTKTSLPPGSPGSDHPRIRGEHPVKVPPRQRHMLDHPRIRGEHRGADHPADARRRIIPAYAGSTVGCGRRTARPRDHPRIRGEHPRLRAAWMLGLGSSPHTRGAQERGQPVSACAGIIPAYAGSTPFPSPTSTPTGDHPRIRGEHLGQGLGDVLGVGSSPHTRGARPCGRAAREAGRIIPAYAGSTRNRQNQTRWTPDHPRIRGEHAGMFAQLAGITGSSPHTRGAPRRIPWMDRRWPDHPRIRGEHRLDIPWPQAMQGSSPHTRGAHIVGPDGYAVTTDHPRIRGEHPSSRPRC